MKEPINCPACSKLFDGWDNMISMVFEDKPHKAAVDGYECPHCYVYMNENKTLIKGFM